jgi:hypothetical protein
MAWILSMAWRHKSDKGSVCVDWELCVAKLASTCTLEIMRLTKFGPMRETMTVSSRLTMKSQRAIIDNFVW